MEINTMTTIQTLKEAQRLQIECVIHKLPIYITIMAMNEQVSIYVQDKKHDVLFNAIFSDDPLLSSYNERYYKDLQQVINRYTAVRLAG